MEHSLIYHPEVKLINVIFNSARPERGHLDRLIRELDRQGILEQTDLYPCIRNRETVAASINASHKMLVRMAKERDMPEVCILEDDAMFPAANGFQHWMDETPTGDWDLYLGGTYSGHNGGRVEKINGLHCYIIRQRFYETFLSVDPTKHIDAILDGLGDYRVVYPYVAIQRPSWSANNNEDVDYNVVLRPEDIYYGDDLAEDLKRRKR